MTTIKLFPLVGAFAENKDIARELRLTQIIPSLEDKKEVVLDFDNVESTTQSFVHALISDLFRNYGNEVLDMLSFKNCNETTRKIISIVVEYMQES